MRTVKDSKNGYLITTCQNNVDLYNYIQKRIEEKGENYWQHIKDSRSARDWQGGVTYNQAINNLIFGNKDTTNTFLEGLDDVRKEKDVHSDVFLDTEGFAYDMGAVVEGEPECCLNSIGEAPKKTINIGITYDFCCGNAARVLAWRGIAITNLIYTLLNKGYIVNLKLIECYKPNYDAFDKYSRSYFSLDIPTENLCIGTIAFYCSVEFFRVIMILVQSMICEQPNRAGDGKGTMDIEDIYEIYGKDMFVIPDGYIDSEMKYLESQEEANKVIESLFNEYCKREGLCF